MTYKPSADARISLPLPESIAVLNDEYGKRFRVADMYIRNDELFVWFSGPYLKADGTDYQNGQRGAVPASRAPALYAEHRKWFWSTVAATYHAVAASYTDWAVRAAAEVMP